MKQTEMNILVPEKLAEIEETYQVKVLWAVESGSRAWGFASDDSDFDVRFIYKRKPEDYLKLNPDRDVIELPIDEIWDVSGWDLDKTLKLLNQSNPTLYEWMDSPIRYIDSSFKERLQPLLDLCFSQKKMLYHYLSTAKSNAAQYLGKEFVIPKKYFYVLRPVLGCRWIMERHTAPPVLFDDLVNTVLPEQMKTTVSDLLEVKMNSPETSTIPRIRKLDTYLQSEIAAVSEYLASLIEDKISHWEELNAFFYREVGL